MHSSSSPAVPATPATEPLRLGVHLLVAVSIAVVAPFTALAWPFAILTGMVIGSADAARLRGRPSTFADSAATGVLAAMGVLAMLFFGAIIGGLIALVVVALTSFSERAAAHASSTDRGVARILLFLTPVVMWLFVLPLLGVDLDIRIGG
jgi:hypothetical protein